MILTSNFYQNKGISLVSVLFTLSIFSMMYLTFNQWRSSQHLRAMIIYQQRQAIQIAKNQQQRQFLHLPCEHQVEQNSLTFFIQCHNGQVNVYTKKFHFTFN